MECDYISVECASRRTIGYQYIQPTIFIPRLVSSPITDRILLVVSHNLHSSFYATGSSRFFCKVVDATNLKKFPSHFLPVVPQSSSQNTHLPTEKPVMDLDLPIAKLILDVVCVAGPQLLFLAPITVFGPLLVRRYPECARRSGLEKVLRRLGVLEACDPPPKGNFPLTPLKREAVASKNTRPAILLLPLKEDAGGAGGLLRRPEVGGESVEVEPDSRRTSSSTAASSSSSPRTKEAEEAAVEEERASQEKARQLFTLQEKGTHDLSMPPLHFEAMLACCGSWFLFGLGIDETALWLVNVPGVVLGGLWVGLYGWFLFSPPPPCSREVLEEPPCGGRTTPRVEESSSYKFQYILETGLVVLILGAMGVGYLVFSNNKQSRQEEAAREEAREEFDSYVGGLFMGNASRTNAGGVIKEVVGRF